MPHFLVVDDSRVEQQIARGLLEKVEGWTVTTASDGAQALELVDEELPDLVLTDLQMPHMDGLQLVETIRNEYPLIPVVLMTAEGSEAIAVKALQRGAASYVSKTDLASDLVSTLQRVLERSAHGRNRRRLLNYLTELQYVIEDNLELLTALVGEVKEIVEERCLFDENDSLRLATVIDEALQLALRRNLDLVPNSSGSQQDSESIMQRQTQFPWNERRLHVRIQIQRDEVAVTVTHSGTPFDICQFENSSTESSLAEADSKGLQLMHALCDEVRFAPSGKSVTVVKKTRWVDETQSIESVQDLH